MDAARQELEDTQNHLSFLGCGSEQSCSNRTPCSSTIDRSDVFRIPYRLYPFGEGMSRSAVSFASLGPARERGVRKCTARVRT